MTILYKVHNNLYVNLTNKCPCSCTFCLRQTMDHVGESDSLWLTREPEYDEIIADFANFDVASFDELVFCGFGEPTERIDVLLKVARYFKETYHKPIRINTNGLGNLVNGRDIAPDFKGLIDTVSISLNTPNADAYMPVEEARSHLKDVAFTVPYSQLIKEQMQKGSLYAPAKDKRFDSRMKEIAGKVVEYEAQ